MNWADTIGLITSAVTAVGVLVAAWQLTLSKRQSRTQFEDNLAREYREIAHKFPVKALLGESLGEDEYAESFHLFYHYIDLTNEQIFLRQKNRVSKSTWENWRDGIKSNMSLPVLSQAWAEIKSKSPSRFEELRHLEEGNFKGDPRKWKKGSAVSLTAPPNKGMQPTAN